MDLISVIVPVYNVEKYFDRCMESVLGQTYKNIEIILIDDGSKDSSGQMCDFYAEKDKRIKVIHKDNAGLGYARNTGLNKAEGKYVIFVDSDDYLEKDMIQNLYEDLIKYSADTCIGGYKRVYTDKTEIHANPFAGQCFSDDLILKSVLVKMFGKERESNDYLEMSVWKILFSNEIIKKYDVLFPSEREFISEDIIFNTDYYKHSNKVYMSSNIGYCYCDNEDSLTTRYRADRFSAQIKLFKELEMRTKRLGIYEESQQRRISTLIAIARYSIKLEEKFKDINGAKVAKNNIKKICNDNTLRDCWHIYNKKNDRFFSRIVNGLIKHKLTQLLWVVMHIKNKVNI